MNPSYIVLIAGLAIGGLHLRSAEHPGITSSPAPTTWPTTFEGKPLEPLPLSEMESVFAASFPGAVAQFQCGGDQVILRQVDRATRKLHDSETCLKAAGFHIDSRSVEARHDGDWLVYRVTRGGQTLHVSEQVRSHQYPEATWTDISQWFWHATFHPHHGPWMAVTVLRQDPGQLHDTGTRQ